MFQTTSFDVQQSGAVTVVGFHPEAVAAGVKLDGLRQELESLIREQGCRTLAFDLKDVATLSTSVLGLLVSLRKLGPQLHLYNASASTLSILEATRLDRIFVLSTIAA